MSSHGIAACESLFVVETCQRHIALSRRVPSVFTPGTEVYQGLSAYRFLLEIACGLHSKMQGESEIFGQIKQGWKEFASGNPARAKGLNRVMQYLFTDTKRIRTDYLHGLGSQSYAGVTQKLLSLKATDRVLILGAGQFGAMFAAKLRNRAASVTVMNRTAAALKTLQKQYPEIHTVTGFGTLEAEMKKATHVLVCLPEGKDTALDAIILKCWKQKKSGHLIHFGIMDFAGTAWAKLARTHSLADVLRQQNAHSETRPHKIASAFSAASVMAGERMDGVTLKSRILQVA